MRRQRRGGAGSADPRWRPGESERARAESGRAGAGPARGSGGRAGLCGRGGRRPSGRQRGRLWARRHSRTLVAPHPSRGPRNCAPARSGTTATGAEAFVARSGLPPSPPLRPPARTRDSPAPGGAGPRRAGANAIRRPAFLRCFSGGGVVT